MTEYFKFYNKKLSLRNGPGCYKITEDALWLLSIIPLDKKNYLDVGCGTGIVSLLLRLKNKNCKIKAIDLQPDMIEHAKEHAKVNNIDDIDFKITDLLKMEKQEFDCVFSNPPFFADSSCQNCEDAIKRKAKFQKDMSCFITKMMSFVASGGCLCFIGHCTTRNEVLNSFKGVYSLTELELVSKENKAAKRYLYIVKKDLDKKFENRKVKTYSKDLRDSVLSNCSKTLYF